MTPFPTDYVFKAVPHRRSTLAAAHGWLQRRRDGANTYARAGRLRVPATHRPGGRPNGGVSGFGGPNALCRRRLCRRRVRSSCTVESENTGPTSGPPAPSPAAASAQVRSGLRALDFPLPDNGLHLTLQELERIQLSSRVQPGTPPARGASPSARNNFPNLGEMLSLNTQTESACTDPTLTTGRVEVVSDRAIIVADTDNPAGGFTQEHYEEFAATFDAFTAPLAEEHFGTPSDIDANGRVIILFTKEVNALESADDESLTSGFFFSRDLFPSVSQGPPLGSCAGSNEAELLYLLVPDPGGEVGPEMELLDVQEFTDVTIAHEYQHLLNASQRLFDAGGPRPFEASWLNEAMSHAMEELMFYEASGLAPGLDLGIDDLDQIQVAALNAFQRLNFFRFLEFLKDPETNSPFDAEVSMATRGGGWNFLRYSADRRGGGNAAFFRELIDSPSTGLDNLSGVLGGTGTVLDWMSDWSVGLYGDNRVPGLAVRFWDRSWDNPSLFDAANLNPPYIMTSNLGLSPVTVQDLAGGGSAYLRFGVAQGQTARLLLSSGGPPPSSLRATVLRTK